MARSALISTLVPLATIRSCKCSASSPASLKARYGHEHAHAAFERPMSTWKASAVAAPLTILPIARCARAMVVA